MIKFLSFSKSKKVNLAKNFRHKTAFSSEATINRINSLLVRFLAHSLINHVTKKCFSFGSARNGEAFLLKQMRSNSTKDSCGVNEAEGTESIEMDETPMIKKKFCFFNFLQLFFPRCFVRKQNCYTQVSSISTWLCQSDRDLSEKKVFTFEIILSFEDQKLTYPNKILYICFCNIYRDGITLILLFCDEFFRFLLKKNSVLIWPRYLAVYLWTVINCLLLIRAKFSYGFAKFLLRISVNFYFKQMNYCNLPRIFLFLNIFYVLRWKIRWQFILCVCMKSNSWKLWQKVCRI